MTQYVFNLDPVGEFSQLNDGDEFTVTPYIPNDEITRVQVGFCSGVYDLVCPSGEPLDVGYFVAGEPYVLTWNATLGKFTTPCVRVCGLVDPNPLEYWPSGVSPPVPDDPDSRFLFITVQENGTDDPPAIVFSYQDGAGSPTVIDSYVYGTTTAAEPTFLTGGYEVRLSREDPETDEWPEFASGDEVDIWLPLTTEREWRFSAFWDESGWNAIGLSLVLEIRQASNPTGCTESATFYLQSGDVS